MARQKVKVTKEQDFSAGVLHPRFFELGYVVVKGNDRFRRSAVDRIAVPKNGSPASQLVYIRLQGDGSISLRPYADRQQFYSLKEHFKKWKKEVTVPLHCRSRPLFFLSEKKFPWYERIAPEYREVLARLGIASC